MERIKSDQFLIPDGVAASKVTRHRYSEAELKRILDEREAAASDARTLVEAKQSLDRWIN